MARRLGIVLLPLTVAAVILLAAAAATAQSDKAPKAQEPKEDKRLVPSGPQPAAPSGKLPNAQGSKEDKPAMEQEPKEDKPAKEQGPKEDKPEDRPSKAQGPKPKPKPMKVKCRDKRKVNPCCFNRNMDCPAACPQSCYADCNACKPVCVFLGRAATRGLSAATAFFHGRRDADFCVVSDRDLHINAHFISKPGAMSRDFTWIQAIAVLFNGHRLYVDAKKTTTWDDTVDRVELTLDGEPVHLLMNQVDVTWTSSRLPALSVTRTKATNGVLVALVGRFTIRANVMPITEEDSRVHRYGVTVDDCLAHLDLAFKFDELTDDVHGVVGQTYRSDYVNRFDVKASMPTMGGEASFTTSSLFAADCSVARFGPSRGNDGSAVMSKLTGRHLHQRHGRPRGGVQEVGKHRW